MKKSTLALAFAVILAVLAVVAVRQYLTREKKEIEKGTRMVPILVATETIPAHKTVLRSWVAPYEIPEKCLLDEMVLAAHTERILGKKSSKTILRGQMLLEPYFKEEVRTHRLAITDGMRIITVGVNAVTGIAGLVSPGDFVDVIWTYRGNVQAGGASTESTMTLFGQAQVYAVDDITTIGYRAASRSQTRGPVTPYTTVTLLLFPLECELLTYALSQGEITLAKRSPTDGLSPPSPGIDGSHLDDLVNQARDIRQRGGGK
ncbi:MAG: Flp pilus assembly protein CpaB [Planctomycetota bacterium]|jgi:pilus assembly protein CpaB